MGCFFFECRYCKLFVVHVPAHLLLFERKMTVIIQISCLVWVLIIYSGHEMCVNARDLCIQTRFRSQEKWEGEKEVAGRERGRAREGGESSQCITL